MMAEACKLGSIAWRFPQEARSPSESAGPDQRSGYHHLANGQVVSKCALSIITKGKGSGFPKPIRSSVLLFRKTIEVVLQRLHVHIVCLRHRFLQDRALLDQPPRPGLAFLDPIPRLRLLVSVYLCLA